MGHFNLPFVNVGNDDKKILYQGRRYAALFILG